MKKSIVASRLDMTLKLSLQMHSSSGSLHQNCTQTYENRLVTIWEDEGDN